jgi:hypothetical protein
MLAGNELRINLEMVTHQFPQSADNSVEESMSTRSSIWLGESEGKCIHIYWELGEREPNEGIGMRAPIYVAADAGDAEKEIAIRLPKEIAIKLLMILSRTWAEDAARVL